MQIFRINIVPAKCCVVSLTCLTKQRTEYSTQKLQVPGLSSKLQIAKGRGKVVF